MAKINEADLYSEKCLETEKRFSARDSAANLLLIIIAAVLILCGGVFTLVLPHKSFSEAENRALQTAPVFSLEKLTDGRYTAEISEFYSDQFPARDFFVGIKAVSELGLLKRENNGVLLCKEGYIAERIEYGEKEYENLNENISAIKDFAAAVDIPLTAVVLPRAEDVLGELLPPLYNDSRAKSGWKTLDSLDFDYINLTEKYKSLLADGENVWYRTDHHYTTTGAYYAYAALTDALGYTPLPLSYFDKVQVSDAFYGTTYSKSGYKFVKPDGMEFFRFEGDEDYTVTYDASERTMAGFYDYSFLSQKDKYSSFLGGNYGLLSVKKNTPEEGRKTLLVIKDSFAHSLAPFLAIHFDLEIIDPRYFRDSAAQLAVECDAVLVFYGIDTLATSDSLKILRYKLHE